MTLPSAEIGIFGGTAFYAFLDDVEEVAVQTPYGAPSAPMAVGTVTGRRVAFLPRHGPAHAIPAHRVNYRANLWALRRLGVRRLLAPCSTGSLQPYVKPGDFVVCDQLVDRTSGRADTFFDGPLPAHVSFADPYCPELGRVAVDAARAEGVTVHERGTVVVIQGPRFSTRAESSWFSAAGWEVVNMTQYPEAVLARELGICYCGLALVTDYDAGAGPSGRERDGERAEAVTMDAVFRVLAENIERVKGVLLRAIPGIPAEPGCGCAEGAMDPGSLPT
ncbi:MAG TPA: S-methyl-5'-thioadenosine phosphorylase [Acidimicrobiales bacterium]|nr:S-methyl-5'-thioadenosine phosphorylase [Acidimicrobiales bacterium]